MRADIIGTKPIGNNSGTATYYNLTTDDGQVVKYHCTKYKSGDHHVSGDTSSRNKNVCAGTYDGGVYRYKVLPQFEKELDFMMKICGISKQGGGKTLRRNRKRSLRTRKTAHKKFTLRSSN